MLSKAKLIQVETVQKWNETTKQTFGVASCPENQIENQNQPKEARDQSSFHFHQLPRLETSPRILLHREKKDPAAKKRISNPPRLS